MNKIKNWFEVDKEGLRQLQAGKPSHFIIRELVQNAWDENIKNCFLCISYERGDCTITISDDNPTGFKDLKDVFTLFAPSYKKSDVSKRGRFNIGEKQIISLCKRAEIRTTTGTIIFSDKGRYINKSAKYDSGTVVSLVIKMNKQDYEDILNMVKVYIPPKHVEFKVNDDIILYKEPYKVHQVESLLTECEDNGILKRKSKDTIIHIHRKIDKAYLYELGIPVCEINCDYSIDVQQKVPLSMDRDTVPESYLNRIYAEILNATHDEISEDQSSSIWVREATSSKHISKDAITDIVNKRWGDKVVVANPRDKISIDDAISNGYKVVRGNELSKEEWENIRKAEIIPSSSDVFGHNQVIGEIVEPDSNMIKIKELIKKIAKEFLNLNVEVEFSKWDGVTAQYGNRILTFNVKKLGNKFFNEPISIEVLDLIIHELSHEYGHHTESSYQNTITNLGTKLVIKALNNPSFFKS